MWSITSTRVTTPGALKGKGLDIVVLRRSHHCDLDESAGPSACDDVAPCRTPYSLVKAGDSPNPKKRSAIAAHAGAGPAVRHTYDDGMDLRTVPKVELHSHLDCCLSFGAAATIAPSLTRARYDADFVAPARCASLAEYLPYTLNYRALLQTEAALRVAVGDVFA